MGPTEQNGAIPALSKGQEGAKGGWRCSSTPLLPFGTVYGCSLTRCSAAPWDGCSHTAAPEALCASKGLRAPKTHGAGGHGGCKGLLGLGLLLGPSFSAVFLSSVQITAAAAKTNSPILHNGKPNPQPLTAHLFLGLAGAEKKKALPFAKPLGASRAVAFPSFGAGFGPGPSAVPRLSQPLWPGSYKPRAGVGLLLSAEALRAAGISLWGIFPPERGGQHRVRVAGGCQPSLLTHLARACSTGTAPSKEETHL